MLAVHMNSRLRVIVGSAASCSFGVVKDDAEGLSVARAQSADSVTQIDSADAAYDLCWPMTHHKGDGIALADGDHIRVRESFGSCSTSTNSPPPKASLSARPGRL